MEAKEALVSAGRHEAVHKCWMMRLPSVLFERVLQMMDMTAMMVLSSVSHTTREALKGRPLDIPLFHGCTLAQLRARFSSLDRPCFWSFAQLVLTVSSRTSLCGFGAWLGEKGKLQLRTLRLDFGHYLANFEDLAGLDNLGTLVLQHLHLLPDPSALACLRQLHTLILHDCPTLLDITVTERMAGIDRLVISKCERLRTVRGLQLLPHLATLVLSDCHSLSDLDSVEGLANSLRSLRLHTCRGLEDLTALGPSLTKLTSLHIAQCPSMRDLTPLGCLPALTELTLADLQQSTGYSCLLRLTQVRSLTLRRCNIAQHELNALGGGSLARLVELTLSGYEGVFDINGWAGGLRGLERLCLEDCPRLTGVDFILSLSRLRYLRVRRCEGLIEGLERVHRLLPEVIDKSRGG